MTLPKVGVVVSVSALLVVLGFVSQTGWGLPTLSAFGASLAVLLVSLMELSGTGRRDESNPSKRVVASGRGSKVHGGRVSRGSILDDCGFYRDPLARTHRRTRRDDDVSSVPMVFPSHTSTNDVDGDRFGGERHNTGGHFGGGHFDTGGGFESSSPSSSDSGSSDSGSSGGDGGGGD